MTCVEEKTCRLCGSRGQRILLHDIISNCNDRFWLNKCDACSFVTIDPMPTDELLQRYYHLDYWQSEEVKTSAVLNSLYKLRMKTIASFIQRNTSYDSKILDWGCGDGAFINLLRASGLHCVGIDAYKTESNDPYILNTTIEKADFPDASFDIITCFHVLEHLPDPLNSIKHALRLLKKGGKLIVEVPNLDAIGFRMFKRNWQPLEIPTHLNHFTPVTLQKVFESAGESEVIKKEFFSHRISPSAFVLSVFPSFSPRRIRKKYKGRYPLSFMGIYFILQLLVYPFALAGALAGKGEIVRMFVRKSGV
jgi:SAM-dependent methyltransferase